jgi:YVTN family beta-propeller protein
MARTRSEVRLAGPPLPLLILTAMVALAIALPPAGAAASTATWSAAMGASGANGKATITAPVTTGTAGTLGLALKGLSASSAYPVKVVKGTCASPGAVLYTGPSQTSTSGGKITKSLPIPSARMNAIRLASAVALRVGTGSKLRCGPFTGGPRPTASPTPTPTPTPVASAIPAKVTAKITVGAYPTSVTVGPQAVYVANSHDWSISRVDPASNSVLSVINLPLTGTSGVPSIMYAEGSLWAAISSIDASGGYLPGSVLRIDPASGAVLATIPVGKTPFAFASSPGAIWVADYRDGSVVRIDPVTNTVAATVALGGRSTGVAYDFGSVWVSNEQTGAISRIDPATNKVVATVPTIGGAEGVATGAGAVWVANYGAEALPLGAVSKIDPATNTVVTAYPVVGHPLFITQGGGSLWLSMDGTPEVVRVDLATPGTLAARLDVGGEAREVAATDHTAWAPVPIPPASQGAQAPPGTLVRLDY